MTDLHYLSAIELAAKLRRHEIGCVELLDHHIARLERINPNINAVIWTDLEAARARARDADVAIRKGDLWGPLHGLPMTIKESFNLTGAPTTWGDPANKDNIAKDNAVATQRLLDAGAIIYGKTNVPFMLADWQSFNAMHGTCNNPWDVTKTPGGSSGGSAAALATGMAALELGSDIGASIRNPAHYCGVLGHKPTHNIVPTRGQSVTGTVSIPDISVAGPMARTADDLALALSILAGSDEIEAPGLKLDLPPPRAHKLRHLRIAVMTSDPSSEVDNEYQAKLTALAEALARQGAKVSFTAKPAFDTREAFKLYVKLLRSFSLARAAPEYIRMLEERAKTLKTEDDSFQAWVLRSFNISYREWLAANEQRHKLRWLWHEFFKEWDVLLCPTAAGPAFPHDQKGERMDRVIQVNGKAENTCHQLFWAGYSGMVFLPSTVCPIERHSNGLPLSVQIIGPHLGDRTTIEVARLIGREFGGFTPPPGY